MTISDFNDYYNPFKKDLHQISIDFIEEAEELCNVLEEQNSSEYDFQTKVGALQYKIDNVLEVIDKTTEDFRMLKHLVSDLPLLYRSCLDRNKSIEIASQILGDVGLSPEYLPFVRKRIEDIMHWKDLQVPSRKTIQQVYQLERDAIVSMSEEDSVPDDRYVVDYCIQHWI